MIFWLLMISQIAIGVAVMTGNAPVGENGPLEGTAAIIVGAVVIVFGLIFSWLSSIAIYAAGAAVDDIQTIKEELSELRK